MSGADERGFPQLLREVTAFSAELPPADVEAAHLSAMTDLAREIANPSGPAGSVIMAGGIRASVPTHRRLAAGLVGSALVTPLCVVALAAAGVRLPGTVRAPFDAAGIELPNQMPAGGLRTVIEGASTPPSVEQAARGIGHTVAEHGRVKHHAHAKHEAGHKKDHGHGGPALVASVSSGAAGSASHGNSAAAPGQGAVNEQPSEAPPAPSPDGGGNPNPQPHPSGTAKQGPGHPAPETRPGKGCGDENHVHQRAGECG